MKKQINAVILIVCVLLSFCCCSKTNGTGEGQTEGLTGGGNQSVKLEAHGIDDECKNWYQVYVKSFFDSDGDGIGDIIGLSGKLSYIKGLGYGGIWLSDVLERDSGVFSVSGEVGEENDVIELTSSAHEEGLEVIIDVKFSKSDFSGGVCDIASDVLKYCLESLHADGVRLVGADGYADGDDENVESVKSIAKTAKSIKSDCYVIAELGINDDELLTRYTKLDVDCIQVYGRGDGTGFLSEMLKIENGNLLCEEMGKNSLFSQTNLGTYISSEATSNRVASYMNGIAQIKMLCGLQMIMNGSISTLYGDEIGMVSPTASGTNLLPMLWDNSQSDGYAGAMTDLDAKDAYDYASVAVQEADEGSIYNYYRQMLNLRNCLPSLSRGKAEQVAYDGDESVGIIKKTYGDEEIIIIINLAKSLDDGYASVKLADELAGKTAICGTSAYGNKYTVEYDEETGEMNIPPYTIVIFR